MFQLEVQQASQTGDASNYELDLIESTNTDGLRVYVGGQLLQPNLYLVNLNPGAYDMVVEVFRGPELYSYEPIQLIFQSTCDMAQVFTTVLLTVSYVRTCARAEFYSNFQTFAVTAAQYVIIICIRYQHYIYGFIRPNAPVTVTIYNPEWDFTTWFAFFCNVRIPRY